MGALVASIRHKGMSIGEVVRRMDRCPRPQVISCFYLAQFNTGNCCIFGISSTDLCC